MSLYSTALMTMKTFVKVFQQEEPAVSRIHTEQSNFFIEFLIGFVKLEVIAQNKDVKKPKKVNFHATENQLPKTMISVGTIANKLLKKVNKDHPTIQDFLSNALKAYAECATYMAEKYCSHRSNCYYIAKIHCSKVTFEVAIPYEKRPSGRRS